VPAAFASFGDSFCASGGSATPVLGKAPAEGSAGGSASPVPDGSSKPDSLGGSARPVFAASAAKPAACSPLVSTTSCGFVAPIHVAQTMPAMASSGRSVTKSWPYTVDAGTPKLRPPTAATSPENAFLLRCASGASTGWIGTRDSSSGSGGARCGFSFATRIT
jgi:hypothetical protein